MSAAPITFAITIAFVLNQTQIQLLDKVLIKYTNAKTYEGFKVSIETHLGGVCMKGLKHKHFFH